MNPGSKTAWILAVWTTDKNWHIDDIKNKDLKDGNDALAVLTPILEDTAKARYNNEGVVRPKAKTT